MSTAANASSEKLTKNTADSDNSNANNPSKPVESSKQSKAKATQTSKKPAGKSTGGWWVLLSLGIALAAIGGCAFLWYELQNAQQANHNNLLALKEELRTIDDHPSIIELKQRILEQDNTLSQTLAEQQTNIDALHSAFETTQQVNNRDQRGWIIAEVEYLLRLAQTRLNLTRDVNGATQAMITADKRLHDLADPDVFKVRERLAEEITALKILNTPDIDGSALRLSSIANRLGLLPQALHPAIDTVEPLQLDIKEPGEEQQLPFWQHTWQNMLKKIGISRIDSPIGAAAIKTELYYIDQLIRLEIEAARYALVRLNKVEFDRRIVNARVLIEDHYDRNHEQVIRIKADLTALLEANLFPELPDISASLIALRNLQVEYKPADNVEIE